MKKILLLLFVLWGTVSAYSQVELKGGYEGEYGEYYVFRVISKGPGTYSVYLNVKYADNFGGPVKRVLTVSAPGEVFRLKRENPSGTSRVRFGYSYVEGDARGRQNTGFVYRLPYSVHKKTIRAFNMNSNEIQFPFVATVFHTDEKDTVYAARKGTVVRIENDYNIPENSKLVFAAKANQIRVVHGDGTVADYLGVERIQVQVGDMVYPDTPIAVAQSFGKGDYRFCFAVSYPVLISEGSNHWVSCFFRPVFVTTEGEKRLADSTVNIAKVDYGLITREMKGREKKKYEQSKISAVGEK